MDSLGTTLTCAFTRWSPGLGDNSIMGWVTVLVYLASALASARTALAVAPEGGGRNERWFWWIASTILVFLAVNKQLDLQSLLTMVGRCHAALAGWYEMRQSVQRLFIWAVAGGGVVSLALLAWLLRGRLARVGLALLGLGFVVCFVVIRAASFHHVDGLLGRTAMGLKVNWLLELPGPILVLAVALWQRRRAAGG